MALIAVVIGTCILFCSTDRATFKMIGVALWQATGRGLDSQGRLIEAEETLTDSSCSVCKKVLIEMGDT